MKDSGDGNPNPYLAFMNKTMLTIYVRKKFLEDTDVLEHAELISEIFTDEELEFGSIKEKPKSSARDTLIVTPPLTHLNEMIRS